MGDKFIFENSELLIECWFDGSDLSPTTMVRTSLNGWGFDISASHQLDRFIRAAGTIRRGERSIS